MKRISLLLTAVTLLCLQSCGQRVEQQEQSSNLVDVRLRQDVTPLQRYAYKAWYSETLRIPLAVSWYLTKEHTYGKSQRKNFSFTPDNDIPNPVTTFDYMQSGYDRGHMCPAGDNKWNRTAQEQTFLMTNICPQNHNLNKNAWNDLEQLCRTWARRYDRIYIVCGPVLRGTNHKTIGRERSRRITVPEAFYKVVLRTGKYPAAIGFIYENVGSSQPMRQAIHSVDEIERLTGIDFFSALDDDIENRIEATSNLSDW
ncbi:MAG: DNA/RNA non-specific endonuclease [Prevotella sp.]|nr:DNA/RNA non-specific endonuclease [Prevotella sp.]